MWVASGCFRQVLRRVFHSIQSNGQQSVYAFETADEHEPTANTCLRKIYATEGDERWCDGCHVSKDCGLSEYYQHFGTRESLDC